MVSSRDQNRVELGLEMPVDLPKTEKNTQTARDQAPNRIPSLENLRPPESTPDINIDQSSANNYSFLLGGILGTLQEGKDRWVSTTR